MLDQIPTEVPNHSKAPTDGVSSSDMLGSAHSRNSELLLLVAAAAGEYGRRKQADQTQSGSRRSR